MAADLSCTLCSSPFSDPRLLPCLHVFCKSCLDPLYSQNEEGTLACPICYKINTCPSPAHLPRHLRIEREVTQSKLHQSQDNDRICQSCDANKKAEAYCEDCVSPICSDCVDTHKLLKITRNHSIVNLDEFKPFNTNVNQSVCCSLHPDESIRYYCCDCYCLVCSECLYTHKKHNWYSVDDTDLEREKMNDIGSVLPQVKTAMLPISETIESVDAIVALIHDNNDEAKRTINEACDRISAAIENRRRELIDQVERTSLAKVTRLQMQKEELEKIMASHQLVVDMGDDTIGKCEGMELLSVEGSLLKASSQFLQESRSCNKHPVCNSSLNVSIDASKIIEPISSLGDIVTCFSPHCAITNINSELPVGIAKGFKCTLMLETKDEGGKELTVGGASVKGTVVVGPSSETLRECEVENLQNGQYEISFDNPQEGQFQVYITVDGVGISGNPLSINVRDYSSMKGRCSASTSYTSSRPTYMVVGPDNLTYVTMENSILVCNNKGKRIREISLSNSCTLLRGIAINNGGIFVVDFDSRRIIKITLAGEVMNSISLPSLVSTSLPSGLCLTKEDLLLVGDRSNQQIQVLDSVDLSFIRSIPCLSRVYGVAVDGTGNIHAAVSDRVQVFSITGENITEYGQRVLTDARDVAVLKGPFHIPYSFVTNYKASVYMFDWSSNTVINSFKSDVNPYGISINQEGTIVVSYSRAVKWF